MTYQAISLGPASGRPEACCEGGSEDGETVDIGVMV